MTCNAIILAAGMGTRLLPITSDIPKCLVEINGKSILERTLDNLAVSGVSNVIIVTGYLQDKIKECIGGRYRRMRISYATNYKYETTNSMFSLHIGLLRNPVDTWVVEGDIIFDRSILALPVHNGISWFVDSKFRDAGGAYLQHDSDGYVTSLDILQNPSKSNNNICKSAGILYLSEESVAMVSRWLWKGVATGETNLYYDLILSKYLDQRNVRIVDVYPAKWYEVDTELDLQAAREMFP